jgi:hypothetical protein
MIHSSTEMRLPAYYTLEKVIANMKTSEILTQQL